MTQGFQRGLLAAERKPVHTANPYPEWCAEFKRFQAGASGEPDPNVTGDTTPATIMSRR